MFLPPLDISSHNLSVVTWLKTLVSTHGLTTDIWTEWEQSGATAAAVYTLTLEGCVAVFGKVPGTIVYSTLHGSSLSQQVSRLEEKVAFLTREVFALKREGRRKLAAGCGR
ncbi:hypothetical protein HDV00_011996 [Rhizophlyctis rosea]|nr:hypothetical protein HDV00_011996 [Rhizophlyctis rosea]